MTLELSWLAAATLPAQDIVAPEDRIKAAFVYNFAKFVEWPTNAFATPAAPLVIGILGKDPFGTVLDDLVKNRTINDRKVELVRYRRVEDVTLVHVLFISESERRRLPSVLNELRDKPVLTVSDIEGFKRQGGMIGLIKVENNIRFEINREAASREGLLLSSKLLRLDKPPSTPDEKPSKPPDSSDPK